MAHPVIVARLYTALSPHFDEENLVSAIMLYEKTFAKKTVLPEKLFTHLIRSRLNTNSSSKNIQASLSKAMHCSQSELLEPSAKFNSKLSNSGLATAESFSILLSQFCENFSYKDRENIVENTNEFLMKLELTPSLLSKILIAIKDAEAKKIINLHQVMLYRAIFSAVYKSACKIRGVAETDKLLVHALNRTNSHPCGKKYDSRNFL